jgi:hypothetical protein
MTKASYTIDPDLTSITPLGNTGTFACLTPGLASLYSINPALIG